MKLKISMQPEDKQSTLNQGYIYRWDRVALGAATLLLTVGLIGWGIYHLLSGSEPQEAELAATTTDERPQEAALATTTDKRPQVRELTPAPPTAPEHRDRPAEAIEATSESPPVKTSDRTAAEPTPAVAPPEPRTSPGAGSTATVAAPAPLPPAGAAPATATLGLFSAPETDISSTNVQRFQLARAVRDKEPVGTLSDVVRSQDGVATVFAYSDVTNMKNANLRYVWSLDDRKIAEVKVPVWSDRWRSYSSKYITESMRGNWRVELRDQSNKVLASTSFRYE